MRKSTVILFTAILVSLVFFANRACLTLKGSKFQSLEEKTEAARLPMSDTDPGLYYTYRTTIYFRDGQFDQQESDYFITGHYMCIFGLLDARSSMGDPISGVYNPFSGLLLWNGERFQRNREQP